MELMVVVAIISILLALLIPNIRTMREKAWSSNCQNNLRQYGIAMSQYMVDNSGWFLYPGIGGGGGADQDAAAPGSDIGDTSVYKMLWQHGNTVGGAGVGRFVTFVSGYIGPKTNVTLASLSAGEPAVQVCPSVLQDLRAANYFDPNSPKFKGYTETTAPDGGTMDSADFESATMAGYDPLSHKLLPEYALTYLDPSFTTYAINSFEIYKNKSAIPQNVVAFIDWNAQDGWAAVLSTNPPSFTCNSWQFTGTNSQGKYVRQGDPKWTNNCLITEVGFHHRGTNSEYGANYVAMDGHVGWVSSNAISTNMFW